MVVPNQPPELVPVDHEAAESTVGFVNSAVLIRKRILADQVGGWNSPLGAARRTRRGFVAAEATSAAVFELNQTRLPGPPHERRR
jgi:hypothetical protein